MNIKSLVVAVGVAAGTIVCDANPAQAQGFGRGGGVAVRLGIGGRRNTNVRYYGPGFYAAPGSYGVSRSYYGGNRQLATQYQQRPWYYSRSGPFEYYRPYNPLYRTR